QGADAADPCASALVCERFETFSAGQPPPAPWLTRENGGTVAVDTTRAYSGSKSVKFTTNTAGSGSFRRALIGYEGAPLFPAAADHLYGRMMIWLEAAPTGSVHWTNVQGEGDVPNQSFRALIRYGGQHDGKLMANYETQGVGSDCWKHSQTTIPEKRWACFEWHFDATKDQMSFWLDGGAIADLTVTAKGSGCISNGTNGNWYFPTFDRVYVGWEHYQQTSQRTMWIDDVAFSNQRIGCPP
ncbi:MAG: hypothetical protein KC503_27170, partial [Myxococcales bacterium]|nr:hypothetical protein [Myxococcales bacterium]